MNEFVLFLKNNNIMEATIATVFSRIVSDLCYSFIENILMPLFKMDLNDDGKPDLNAIGNITIEIFGCKIKLGLFIMEIFKFIIMLLVVFYLTKI